MRVLLSGGGTGGHLYPALAIAEALRRRRPEVEILFVGGDRIEARIVPQEGWTFHTIASRGLPRRPSLGTLMALGATAVGTAQAARLFWRWRPDVVVATGGYVCVPVGCAAGIFRTPLLIQEQNLRPGLATRILARWAQCTSVPHALTASRLASRRTEVTGVPVRRRAFEGDRARAMARWNLSDDRLTLLVIGGSQGAASVNRGVSRLADLLMYERRLQILHHTGAEHVHSVREAIGHREHVGPPSLRHIAVPFLDPIGDAYACADLVLCRAGASTLAEVTACGLPAVLVPYPHAGGHQEENAAVLVNAGAAVRVGDDELEGTTLVRIISALVDDRARRTAMAAASRGLGRPNAADVLAGLVETLGHGGRVAEVRA
ncbi:MAG TPA: undecaprenyldiphospho-muramoylpentapeptide beta-N-acetylglucosaminyltransferase [bacterium]|nr:undecaprenyldiphospho-muramoylpentapeptide beta-N-acetylglucosaminyltransferase [bacterium]